MKGIVTVREYARLTFGPSRNSFDEATVTQADFDWLCCLSTSFRRSGAPLLHVNDGQWLQLDNFVGVIEMPSGQCLEILPKYIDGSADVAESRKLLCKMIQAVMNLPFRDAGVADLALFDAPVTEWIIRQFLVATDRLVKRGLRFDYTRIEDEQQFLRGQLDISRQLRQPGGRQHLFRIRHDVFLPDGSENRLIKSALAIAGANTHDAKNWRLAHELLGLIAEIPSSLQIGEDFKRWRRDRLMAHYEGVRSWCELILRQQLPMAGNGAWRGISLLFPMEKLFERYVETSLRKMLPEDICFVSQSTSKYLCAHEEQGFFQLRPDIWLSGHGQKWVLDTKWKLLDTLDRTNHYGLSQSDFYQLFAYGQKYLEGQGDVILIFPKTPKFWEPLPPFYFSEALRLWVLPFDLNKKQLIAPLFGLPLFSLYNSQNPSLAVAQTV